MSVFDGLININSQGDFIYSGWIEWKHVSYGLTHCPTCLKLDNCWFNNLKKPQLPQHENCHCEAIPIATPTDLNTTAQCPLSKFTDYIFSDKYAWNGKRDLFNQLGFSIKDSEFLKNEYEKQAKKKYCESAYTLGKLDDQGQRINIDIEFFKNFRYIKFVSGWMVRPKGEITNNTPLGD